MEPEKHYVTFEEYKRILKDCKCAVQLVCDLHVKAPAMYKAIKDFCAGMEENRITAAADAYELFQALVWEIDEPV